MGFLHPGFTECETHTSETNAQLQAIPLVISLQTFFKARFTEMQSCQWTTNQFW